MRYKVIVTRSEDVSKEFDVDADSHDEAERKALAIAYDTEFERSGDAVYKCDCQEVDCYCDVDGEVLSKGDRCFFWDSGFSNSIVDIFRGTKDSKYRYEHGVTLARKNCRKVNSQTFFCKLSTMPYGTVLVGPKSRVSNPGFMLTENGITLNNGLCISSFDKAVFPDGGEWVF